MKPVDTVIDNYCYEDAKSTYDAYLKFKKSKIKKNMVVGVAALVLGGIVGAGIMKGVMTIQLKNGLEDFKKNFKSELESALEADRKESLSKRSIYSNHNGLIRKQVIDQPSDVIFGNGQIAWSVVSDMEDLIARYGKVTVGDFYRISGIEGQYTDESMGWTNIDNITSRENRCGVSLNIPEPIELEGEK